MAWPQLILILLLVTLVTFLMGSLWARWRLSSQFRKQANFLADSCADSSCIEDWKKSQEYYQLADLILLGTPWPK